MKKLQLVITLHFILTAVSGFNSNGSIFAVQTFNTTTQPAADQTDICYSADLFQTAECSPDQNVTLYSYACIMDQTTLSTSSFLQCNGTKGTQAYGISQFLNLTTSERNTSYANLSDYDISNCTISSDQANISCIYQVSGVYQMNVTKINYTNTTIQQNPYNEFCEVFLNTTSNFSINCTSSINLYQSVQQLICTGPNNSNSSNSTNSTSSTSTTTDTTDTATPTSSSSINYTLLGNYQNCSYAYADGSIKNKTIYTSTLTTFVTNQTTNITDVLQNSYNISNNGKAYIQSQYLFSYDNNASSQMNPYICNGTISNMKQACSNDSFNTTVVYDCVYNTVTNHSLVCQQENANSNATTIDETKFLNVQSGLQYVQYGNSSQITVNYCQIDLTSLNDSCIYLYTYYQNNTDQRQNNSVNVTFENTGTNNLNVYWVDYFGNEQYYQNLPGGYLYQQQTFQGDQWVIRNSKNNQSILNFVVQNRSQYIKVPATSASFNSSNSAQNITFNNLLNYSLSLNLLNSYKKEVSYKIIGPQSNYTQTTLPGNQWVVRNVSNSNEIFTCFGSVANQTYNITTSVNANQISQSKSNFSQKQNYTLNCSMKLDGTNVQTCTDGYYKGLLNCSSVNSSQLCTSSNYQFQKLSLTNTNISFVTNQQNALTVMKCSYQLSTLFFNQSCIYFYTIYNQQVNLYNLVYQMPSNSTILGMQATVNEGYLIKSSQQATGSEILMVYNNSKKISQCSYNLNGLYYCTTDKQGLNFFAQYCIYNKQYSYVGCQIVNYVQCQSFNTSGCVYSIYYDKDYDWNAYLLKLQNQSTSQNSTQIQVVNNANQINVYQRVQTQIYYDQNNILIQSLDNSKGQLCYTLDQQMCLSSANVGMKGKGTYCYTYNGFQCFQGNSLRCNFSSGYLCATSDGVSPSNLTQCVSFDNQTCYSDYGQFCGSSNLLTCNISRLVNTCQTRNGASCYTFGVGWRYTQDGANTYQNALPNKQNGTYCYSKNGNNCNRNTLNILRQDALSCLTNDNLTCLKDNGQRCNSTGHLNWCNIPYASQSCQTLDMINCLKGIWIKTSSTSNQTGNTTFCYSTDGKACKKSQGGTDCQNGNSLSTYLCQYQRDQNNNYIKKLQAITQCLSYDSINCFQDVETNCGNTQQNPYCQIQNTNNYCQTTNNINCSTLSPGIFFTYDGVKISPIYPQSFQLKGTYCYSSNGVQCDITYGLNCNPDDGYQCSSYDRINQVPSIQCAQDPHNSKICYIDYGSACNPSQSNLDGSCGYSSQSLCLSADQGNTCLQLSQGWYYTQDSINVYQQQDPNAKVGSYCYSTDGKKCQITQDPICSTKQNKSQCVNSTQCLTLNSQSCYNDSGSFCNVSSRLNSTCNINLYSQNCSSTDGKSCYISQLAQQNSNSNTNTTMLAYNTQTNNNSIIFIQYLWCFSMDGVNCYDPQDYSAVTSGLYCQTQDGYVCYQDYGPKCNLTSGYMCTTSDRVNLALVSYCATQDNSTCVRDVGSFCQGTISSYCNIPANQAKCFSLDGNNCYDFVKRWYFTVDTIKVYQGQINQGVLGSYCYSNDAINCISRWNFFTSNQISNCISQNNQTCYKDYGALCSNTQNINFCLINNVTNYCETIDHQSCSNLNWIKRQNSDTLCYSIDGKSCLATLGGINCKSQISDYLCSYVNGAPQNMTLCYSFDGKKCYQCVNTNYKKCFTQGDTQNICNTIDGVNCVQLSSGWYFTQDGLAVYSLPNLTSALPTTNTYGFYCQSSDSYKCSPSYGPNCDTTTGQLCAQDVHQNFINVSQCITTNNNACYQDQGQICAPIRKQNPGGSCDLQISQVSCSTDPNVPTHQCFDFISGWYFTVDGKTTNQLQSKNGSTGTYCYSNNGNNCFSNNGQYCDLSTGYKCASLNKIFLSQVTYCITQDNVNCYQDLGNKCNQTNLQGSCNINNDTMSCESIDGLTCYKNQKGWYITFDGLTVGLNFLHQNQLRSYCYSEDGYLCKLTYGQNCNLTSGFLCTSTDGVSLAKAINCISFNNQTCYYDYGKLCNYTGSNAWCNIYNQTSNCPSLDGSTCYDFKSGWYQTPDLKQIIPSGQSQSSYYCFSNNGLTCYSDFGAVCNNSTGYMCSTTDGISPQPIDYCITDNNQNCKKDNGQFCNYTGSQKWCNIYTYTQSCMTMFGSGNCYNPIQRFYMTYDGINVNNQPNGLSGYLANYCYSQDGSQCYQDYGTYCDQMTGVLCSTSNGVNLQLGSYCISADNKTCFKDIGALCNNTNELNWCQINNNTNTCFTQDSQNCFDYASQYCLSFDGVYCTTQKISIQKGTYCWSNDGVQCSHSGIPRCDPTVQVCSALNATFCVTSDYLTCLSDTGYFCNSTYNLASCNINYDVTQFCETYDSKNCVNQGSLLKNYTQDQIQRRSLRQYFFYAIQGSVYNVTQPGVCSPDCGKWKDKCCVNVQKQVGSGYVQFDNLCMNTYVAQNSMNFQLNGQQYVLTCNENYLQKAKAQILQLYSICLIAISSLIIYISH